MTFFLFSFAVNVNEQRIIAFLTEKCYLNLRGKVGTPLSESASARTAIDALHGWLTVDQTDE